MNEHVRLTPPLEMPSTQAAEGLPRKKWSREEIETLSETGFFQHRDHFELIGGEIVPMSPKGFRHERVKMAVAEFVYRNLPQDFATIPETTLWHDQFNFFEPDFIVFPRDPGLENLRPAGCLLAIEVAASSLAYDLGRKAQLFAEQGMPELWVIDVADLVTTVHTDPSETGYATVTKVPASDPLPFRFAPPLALRLADLDLA